MSYIGAPLVSTNFVLDQYTATAGQTAFVMTRSPASAQSVLVGIDGVVQEPGTAYTVSGTTLTMSSGVPLNARVWIVHLGVRGTLQAPADGSVEFASLGTTLTGSVVQSVYSEYTAATVITAGIPNDDTIPQISEGAEVLTASITPRASANKIRVRFHGQYAVSATAPAVIVALFRDATAGALAAIKEDAENTAGWSGQIGLVFEHSPGTTSSVTYRIRAGISSGNLYFNANGAGTRVLGGSSRAVLTLEEIKA